MVSQRLLVDRLREILASSDLNTTTTGAVRRQLESEFGVDLSEQKKFISQQIDEILEEGDAAANENGGANEEVVDEEDDDDDENNKSEEPEPEPEPEPPKKRRGSGFTRLCSLSPQLQHFVGVSEMSRTEVVKKLWAYIRENNLQDPNDRRNIKCDDKLHSIFRVDTINMFKMNKALTKHIWPLEAEQESSGNAPPPEKKQKRPREDSESSGNAPPPKKKQKRPREEAQTEVGKPKQKGGFNAPLQLSETFVKFLGTGETTLSRADAVKRIWNYIKENDLQDPSNKRMILCDEKLKELFEMDAFNGFVMTKYLSGHLRKMEG